MHKNISSYVDHTKILPELNIGIKFIDLVEALRKLSNKDREEFIENLLAATSPEYIKSIKEAREDYKKGRVSTHTEVFRNKKTKNSK
jgi:hypothetical protein